MNLPRFSAEASLYQTNGHYQTPRQSISLPTQMIGTVHLSMEPIEWPGPGEVISISGGVCPPGWHDIGGSCWPNPLTEPPVGGGGGGDSGTSDEPFDVKPRGGVKKKDKKDKKDKPIIRIIRRDPGRDCLAKDVGGDLGKAEEQCLMKHPVKPHRLRCFDNPDGTVDPICCTFTPTPSGEPKPGSWFCIKVEPV